jgi:hypothetical protein
VLYPSGRHVPPNVVAFVQAISEAFRLLLDDAPSSAQRVGDETARGWIWTSPPSE